MTNEETIKYRCVLAHELERAKDAFDSFFNCAGTRLLVKDNTELAVKSYEHYTDFIAHLYEFYAGCIFLEPTLPEKLSPKETDRILTEEARKFLRLKLAAIDGGIAPEWENDRSHYEVEVSDDFGKHWRFMRNRRNHVSARRHTGEDITVSEFYAKYHQFVFILFSMRQWNWGIKDYNEFDWGDIAEFNAIVRESPNKNTKATR